MVGNTKNSKSILRLLDLLSQRLLRHNLGYKLILNKNKSFHGMLKSQLMLTHLTEDGTDIEMNVCWVKDLKTIVNAFITIMKIVILNF
jgi:hypothetical protein